MVAVLRQVLSKNHVFKISEISKYGYEASIKKKSIADTAWYPTTVGNKYLTSLKKIRQHNNTDANQGP